MIDYKPDPILDHYAFASVKGNNILFRGLDKKGRFIDNVIKDFSPTYYIKSNKNQDALSIYEEPLKKVSFESIAESRKWKNEMDGMIDIYGDIGPEYQFISTLPKTVPMTKDALKYLIYDIETEVDSGLKVSEMAKNAIDAVTLISTFDNVTNSIKIFSYKDYNVSEYEHLFDGYKVEKVLCANEVDLLTKFVMFFKEVNPHLLSGWNTNGFDNLFMYNRIRKLLGEYAVKSMSPFDEVKTREFTNGFGQAQTEVTWVGVVNFDYLDVYKTYTYHAMANYKLDTVAEFETGRQKLHHDGSFKDFYKNNWDKFVAYNIVDTILVNEIDKKTGLFDVALSVAYQCGANLGDTFGTVKKLDVLSFNFLLKENRVIPPAKRGDSETFPGGYVMDPVKGLHRAIVSYDFTSLYPSIIRESNISPEALVNPYELPDNIRNVVAQASPERFAARDLDLSCLKGTPYTLTAAGYIYDTSKPGFVNKIMTYLFEGRKAAKKLMLKAQKEYNEIADKLDTPEMVEKYKALKLEAIIQNNIQMALKILLNSFFGAYGNSNFRYYNLAHAKSITLNGQAVVQHVRDELDKWFKATFGIKQSCAVYCDTDSVVGSTLVYYNGNKIKIEDLYNQLEGVIEVRGNNDYIKHVVGSPTTKTLKGDKVVDKKINYIMKHKVKKKIYRCYVADLFVDVTEDHSVMVLRDGCVSVAKPDEILDSDMFIMNVGDGGVEFLNGDWECLGELELDVYDLEVDETHTFFANDILVHNSNYFTLDPILKKIGIDPVKDFDKAEEIMLKFADGTIQDQVTRICEEYAEWRNVPVNLMHMDREAIAPMGGFWTGKKRYALAVTNMEGVSYPKSKPKWKVMGLEAIKAGKYTGFLREALEELIETIILSNESAVHRDVEATKKKFMSVAIPEIAAMTNVNEVNKWIQGSTLKSGTPIGVRAVFTHNSWLDKIGDTDIPRIEEGEKIMYVPLRPNNPTGSPVIGFTEWSGALTQLEPYVDKIAMWDKNFVKAAESLTSAVNWSLVFKPKLF